MKLTLLAAALLSTATAVAQAPAEASSPNGQVKVTTTTDTDGLTYSVTFDGHDVITPSRLGLETNVLTLGKGFNIDSSKVEKYTDSYSLDRIKRSNISVDATKLTVYASNADKYALSIEFVIENNAVAFRYLVPWQGTNGSIRIMNELTEFRFPSQTLTYLCPQSDAMIGWKRTKPSYEEEYELRKPMTEKSKFGHGYTFPCLFEIADNSATTWALVSETGVNSKYCACHLSDYADGAYTVALAMPEENNGNGTAEPAFALPGATPWRTISLGNTAGQAAEQTITWDVVSPQYESAHSYAYGKGTWSWILWQDNSINLDDQKAFVDLASEIGYQYTLVDCGWDINIGRKGMEELAQYAKSKNVDLVVWYSSSGYWNDIVQSPVNLMDRAIVRKQEMRWLKSIGAKGIKVDFWGGDKQETMRLYEDVLSDADDAGLFVIFHGTTLPRGWERMYPNYVGSEAVLASENLIFEQHFCDTEALCATLHPFIRNAVGCMEYGGSFMNKRMSRDNASGNTRLTTNIFSLATAILFQNPIQFFALAPNNLQDTPDYCINFMRNVPTTWDDIKILDGTPGQYVVLARKSGTKWYVAAINATDKDIKVNVELPFAKTSEIDVYLDNKKGASYSKSKVTKKLGNLTIIPNGGIVMVGE